MSFSGGISGDEQFTTSLTNYNDNDVYNVHMDTDRQHVFFCEPKSCIAGYTNDWPWGSTTASTDDVWQTMEVVNKTMEDYFLHL